MSTTVFNDSIAYPTDSPTVKSKPIPSISMEVKFADCECCDLKEECTSEYIETIRKRFKGKWICGLCAEAIKDEIDRCKRLMISSDEALSRHLSFCNKFKSSNPTTDDPAIHLIGAMKQVFRKSFRSSKSLRSMPSSPTKFGKVEGAAGAGGLLFRSESCMPSLNLADTADFSTMEITND